MLLQRQWTLFFLFSLLIFNPGLQARANALTTEAGMQAYNAGEYDRAYDIFSELFRKNPQNVQVNYGLGLSAAARGKLSHALFAFDRVLQVEPNNMRARLERARIYYSLGQYELARAEFSQVSGTRPPEQVQKNIGLFMEAMDRAERKYSFSARLDFRVVYDDNLNFGPAAATIDTLLGELEVLGDSRPLEAWGLNTGVGAGGVYDFGERGGWLSYADAGFSQDIYDDAPRQEITMLQGGAGLRRFGQITLLELPVRFISLDYGHDDLVDMAGIYPSAVFMAASQWHLIGRLSLEDRNYKDNDLRDADFVQAAGTLRRLFDGGRASLSLNAGVFDENSDGDMFQNEGWTAGLSGDCRVSDWFTAYAGAQYRRSEYGAILYPDLQDVPREDDQWQFIAGLRRELKKYWTVDLNHRHISNSSNFGLYDYDKNVTTVSTSLTF